MLGGTEQHALFNFLLREKRIKQDLQIYTHRHTDYMFTEQIWNPHYFITQIQAIKLQNY